MFYRLGEPPHDNTNKMTCVPNELRSAWASAQSISLCCPHHDKINKMTCAASEDRSAWACAQSDHAEPLLSA